MRSGIYQITNALNGKRYVGSAVNLKRRWGEHLRRLRGGSHDNRHLQNAFYKYGDAAFVFSVLEPVANPAELIGREQYHLDTLNPEYNISRMAGSSLGIKRSEETRRKISEANRGERNPHYGKHLSEQHRRRISEALKGERNHNYGKRLSEETRRKLSEACRGERNHNYGKHLSEETRRNIGKAVKGRSLSEDHKRKIGQANSGERSAWYGRRHTEETKCKMSEAHKGRHHSKESKRKMSEARKTWWRRKCGESCPSV